MSGVSRGLVCDDGIRGLGVRVDSGEGEGASEELALRSCPELLDRRLRVRLEILKWVREDIVSREGEGCVLLSGIVLGDGKKGWCRR